MKKLTGSQAVLLAFFMDEQNEEWLLGLAPCVVTRELIEDVGDVFGGDAQEFLARYEDETFTDDLARMILEPDRR